MRLSLCMSVLCLWTFMDGWAWGCMCFVDPICSRIGHLSESDAVFVGTVVDIWPSREKLASEAVKNLPLAAWKQVVLQRWSEVLSDEEKRFIRTTQSSGEFEYRYAIMQRVRVKVNETLAGPQIQEVYTNASSCGYRFVPGKVYLIVSACGGKRCWTGACSGTSSVGSEEAAEDLQALRAWKAGKPLTPRIYGRIDSKYLRPDTRIRLIDAGEERSVPLGPNGRFSIDGLEKKTYRLEIEDARGKGERTIDLSHFGCFVAAPWFGGKWGVAGGPTVLESRPANQLRDPPVLPTAPPGP